MHISYNYYHAQKNTYEMGTYFCGSNILGYLLSNPYIFYNYVLHLVLLNFPYKVIKKIVYRMLLQQHSEHYLLYAVTYESIIRLLHLITTIFMVKDKNRDKVIYSDPIPKK